MGNLRNAGQVLQHTFYQEKKLKTKKNRSLGYRIAPVITIRSNRIMPRLHAS